MKRPAGLNLASLIQQGLCWWVLFSLPCPFAIFVTEHPHVKTFPCYSILALRDCLAVWHLWQPSKQKSVFLFRCDTIDAVQLNDRISQTNYNVCVSVGWTKLKLSPILLFLILYVLLGLKLLIWNLEMVNLLINFYPSMYMTDFFL